MKAKVNDILDERETRYGNYLNQTNISHSLKSTIRSQEKFSFMEHDQQDALEMIAVKISRILNGDPDYEDNWRDIAGYATLVADRLSTK